MCVCVEGGCGGACWGGGVRVFGGGGGRCTDAPANSIFSCPVTSVFSAMRFNEESFTRQCEVKEKDQKEGLRV